MSLCKGTPNTMSPLAQDKYQSPWYNLQDSSLSGSQQPLSSALSSVTSPIRLHAPVPQERVLFHFPSSYETLLHLWLFSFTQVTLPHPIKVCLKVISLGTLIFPGFLSLLYAPIIPHCKAYPTSNLFLTVFLTLLTAKSMKVEISPILFVLAFLVPKHSIFIFYVWFTYSKMYIP